MRCIFYMSKNLQNKTITKIHLKNVKKCNCSHQYRVNNELAKRQTSVASCRRCIFMYVPLHAHILQFAPLAEMANELF